MTPEPTQPSSSQKSTSTIVIVIILVAVGACCIVGVLAAIAIPNFIKFQARSKQSECKTNLRALYTAEKSLYAEKDIYSTDLKELGFSPEATRYTYFLGHGQVISPRMGVAVTEAELMAAAPAATPGLMGDCPKCEFTAACAGNIDTDAELDVWSVSSAPRQCHGEPLPPGMPCNDVPDL